MDINGRFNQIITTLFKGNKSAFASAVGVTPSVVDNIVGKRQGKPSFEVLEKVSAIAEINIEWLITGNGNMLKEQTQKPAAITKKEKLISTHSGTETHFEALTETTKKAPGAIPLVSERAVGGFANEHFTIKEKDVLAYYVIPKFRHLGVDFMIEVIGDSMIPRLYPGDIIACSIIHNSQFIQWNKPHLIATREQGLIVKRLRKSMEKDCLLAVSDNHEYDPFDIPKDEIVGIARVVGVIHLE
jgi:phage repressor protein C with HTH and peptisase S24 domain